MKASHLWNMAFIGYAAITLPPFHLGATAKEEITRFTTMLSTYNGPSCIQEHINKVLNTLNQLQTESCQNIDSHISFLRASYELVTVFTEPIDHHEELIIALQANAGKDQFMHDNILLLHQLLNTTKALNNDENIYTTRESIVCGFWHFALANQCVRAFNSLFCLYFELFEKNQLPIPSINQHVVESIAALVKHLADGSSPDTIQNAAASTEYSYRPFLEKDVDEFFGGKASIIAAIAHHQTLFFETAKAAAAHMLSNAYSILEKELSNFHSFNPDLFVKKLKEASTVPK
jgi:hypothetical protein